jgi:hypothetical protein
MSFPKGICCCPSVAGVVAVAFAFLSVIPEGNLLLSFASASANGRTTNPLTTIRANPYDSPVFH